MAVDKMQSCYRQIMATLWRTLGPILNFAFFTKITIEDKNPKGMHPNFGQGPNYGKQTRLFSKLFGVGICLWSLVAISDVDNTFAD